MTFRKKTAKFLTRPIVIIVAILTSLALSIIANGIGPIFGFVVIFLTLWSLKWDWSYFGFQRNPLLKTIFRALIYTAFIILVNDIIFQPLIELFLGQTDLSSFEGLKGNIANYLIFLLIMWVFAAFGEEFFYRGYVLKRIAVILGDSEKSWALAIIISSVIFGLAHLYQGASGVITTGFVAIIFGIIFYKNKKNLWVGVLTHGFYDVFGITMIFLDKERVITNWAQEHIFFFI